MPQHNPTRYVKENSHFSGVKSIEQIQDEWDDEWGECDVCGKWTYRLLYFMYCDDNRLFCYRCYIEECREEQPNRYPLYNFQDVGFLLMDYQSICDIPHFQFNGIH